MAVMAAMLLSIEFFLVSSPRFVNECQDGRAGRRSKSFFYCYSIFIPIYSISVDFNYELIQNEFH